MRAPSGISSPFEPGGIALAVPALVVAEDQRRHRIRERHAADDLGADLRVDADLLELFLRQRPGLRQDVLGHRQLADVVQQRRGLDALDLVLRHAERAREAGGVDLHAADVALRGLILGVDRQRQRFDRRQVQVRHLLRRAAADPGCGPCRPCRCGRSGRAAPRRATPSSSRRGRSTARGDAAAPRADEVARRAPQEVLVPHARRSAAASTGRSPSR